MCGRVCPQEEQCQKPCALAKALKDPRKAVSVGKIERFLADWERDNDQIEIPLDPSRDGQERWRSSGAVRPDSRRGRSAQTGPRRDLFEALHKTGGVLVYGIPEFRLPKVIVEKEVELLKRMGVDIRRQ